MEPQLAADILTSLGELKHSVESLNTSWMTLVASAIVGGLGLAGALGAPAYTEWRRRRNESETLRAALAADIRASIGVIQNRQYLEALQKGPSEGEPGLEVAIPEDAFSMFKSNAGLVGLLSPDDANDIVTFYFLLESVVQDVKPGGVLSKALRAPSVTQQTKDTFQRDALLLEQALAIGERFLARKP
ncbi:hypothetical protein [Salinicola rhizosphaerae]|uniref:Uncharacterized protein n=1 Tax=Salinicola rhizosphaerae TaxID=1443141 RepID=A0ABQ3E685_9GAMM|nr:hypothetical protein [Salinicola rhizosphaerae]GHB24526.1 hypothetical protein GCM10009038_24510 [Salinicola rhizosphaerae]